jgi:hypothetical protein
LAVDISDDPDFCKRFIMNCEDMFV